MFCGSTIVMFKSSVLICSLVEKIKVTGSFSVNMTLSSIPLNGSIEALKTSSPVIDPATRTEVSKMQN